MAPSTPPSLILSRAGLPTLADLPAGVFILDDSNTTSINYTLPFLQVSNDTCHGGTCTELLSATGFLEFNFTGTDVWLFGKPGGIARIFLDGSLADVLDSASIPNDGRALWATNDLPSTTHSLTVAGVDGDDLNLLVDFFGIVGTVSGPQTTTPSESNDPSTVQPSPSETRKLTGIIVGTLIAFLSVLFLISLFVFFYLRRKKARARARNGFAKPSSSLPRFSFGKKRLSRKPIVLIRRRSIDKEPGLTPFASSYPSSYTDQSGQRTADQSVPRFILPDSPPPIRPTLVIPNEKGPQVPPKISPSQYLISKLPWSNVTRAAANTSSSDQLERTPLMEVSSRYPTFPWRERQQVAEYPAGDLESSDGRSSQDHGTETAIANTFGRADMRMSRGLDIPMERNPRTDPFSREPIRGESFGTIASSVVSPPSPPPSFKSQMSPAQNHRPLPAVPESVADHGPKEEPFEDERLAPQDRYGWRNGLEQWNRVGGVRLTRDGAEAPL